MATMNPFDEYNTEDAAGKGGKKKDKKVAQIPDYIFESIQRQYGNKKYGDYTIEDKKNVINWYKKNKA